VAQNVPCVPGKDSLILFGCGNGKVSFGSHSSENMSVFHASIIKHMMPGRSIAETFYKASKETFKYQKLFKSSCSAIVESITFYESKAFMKQMESSTEDSIKKFLENPDEILDSRAIAAESERDFYKKKLESLEEENKIIRQDMRRTEDERDRYKSIVTSIDETLHHPSLPPGIPSINRDLTSTVSDLKRKAESAASTVKLLTTRLGNVENTSRSLLIRANQAESNHKLECERVESIMMDFEKTEVALEYEATQSCFEKFGHWLRRYFCCSSRSQRHLPRTSYYKWTLAIGRDRSPGCNGRSNDYSIVRML
jgi:hypothetical protein